MNYDDELWSQIETALHSDDFGNIEVLNRAQIVDDVFNLARAGLISYTRALNIISYLEQETEYYPWYSAFTELTYLNRRIGKDETLGPLFQVRSFRHYKHCCKSILHISRNLFLLAFRRL